MYGVVDGLGQVMPVRDGGERMRLATGHRLFALSFTRILANLSAGSSLPITQKENGPSNFRGRLITLPLHYAALNA